MISIANIVDFLRSKWIRIAITAATIFVPLVGGFVFLLMLGDNYWLPQILQNVPGSKYLTNNILILFILVGYMIVFLGLILYFSDILRLAVEYKGGNNLILKLSYGALLAAVTAIGLVSIFVFFMYESFAQMTEVSFEKIIEYNKYVTLVCFSLFVVIDVLIIVSKNVELTELQSAIGSHSDTGRRCKHNENAINLSLNSTLLINVPIIAMTLVVAWLIHFITTHPESFEAIHDTTLGLNVPVSVQLVDWFLFLNGIETGMIASSVMVSQIVFLILKIRFHYREHIVEKM